MTNSTSGTKSDGFYTHTETGSKYLHMGFMFPFVFQPN